MSITTTAIPHIPAMDGALGRSHFPITVPLNSCNNPQTVKSMCWKDRAAKWRYPVFTVRLLGRQMNWFQSLPSQDFWS